MSWSTPIQLERTLRQAFLYVQHKHGLSNLTAAATVQEAADRCVGIHAARIQSPPVAVHARSFPKLRLDLRREANVDRSVIKLRCMRGTLHYCSLKLAPIVHQATLKNRLRLCTQLKASVGVDKTLEHFIRERCLDECDGAILPGATIQKRVVAKCARKFPGTDEQKLAASVRVILKDLWENGFLFYQNGASLFGREEREFGLTKDHFKSLDWKCHSSDDATRLLVYRYFQQYGPASIRDVCWWSGISSKAIAAALMDLGREVRPIRLADCAPELYMALDDIDQFEQFSYHYDDQPILLAYEDSLLKGYFETRNRYIAPKNYNKLFNQIGEARASISIRGRVEGTWSWNSRNKRILFQPFARQPKKVNDELHIRVNEMEHLIRQSSDQPDLFEADRSVAAN